MSSVEVSPDAIRAYGETAAGISAELAAAGGGDRAATLAATVAELGLIRPDFVAAFGVAQSNHAANIADLAGRFGNRANFAHHTAHAYENTDQTTTDRLNTIGNRFGTKS